jgi:hypothetical protein
MYVLFAGEHMDQFEQFETKRFVGRLLGRGDVTGLMDKIQVRPQGLGLRVLREGGVCGLGHVCVGGGEGGMSVVLAGRPGDDCWYAETLQDSWTRFRCGA